MRKLVSLLSLLLFLSFLSAIGQVVSFSLVLYENDTVQPAGISIGAGEPSRFISPTGAYQVAISDANGKTISRMGFDTDFWKLSDPPQKVDRVPFFSRLGYYPEARWLVMTHKGREIFRYPLPANVSCAQDGYCHPGENAVSCPGDCNISNDHSCTSFSDHICDLDCPAGRDPDCSAAPPARPFPIPAWAICFGFVFVAGIIIALIGAAIFVNSRTDKTRPPPARPKVKQRQRPAPKS